MSEGHDRDHDQGNEHVVAVDGVLDNQSVPGRLRQSAGWFQAGRETLIDLAQVERVDSAGVALLLEWIRDANAVDARLTFINAPAQMRAIIDFCALGDVIPLRRENARAA